MYVASNHFWRKPNALEWLSNSCPVGPPNRALWPYCRRTYGTHCLCKTTHMIVVYSTNAVFLLVHRLPRNIQHHRLTQLVVENKKSTEVPCRSSSTIPRRCLFHHCCYRHCHCRHYGCNHGSFSPSLYLFRTLSRTLPSILLLHCILLLLRPFILKHRRGNTFPLHYILYIEELSIFYLLILICGGP